MMTRMGEILDAQSYHLSLALVFVVTPALFPTGTQHQVSFNVLVAADIHSFIFTL